MLLPPKVLGPINQLATSVTVVGAVDGATVQLLVNGAPVGVPAVASGLSVSVGLGGTVLTPGQQVAATQSRTGETSAPSPFPETVSAAPSPASGLPAPVFLSGLHPCVDWILMGGLIPGATVEIRRAGQRIGTAVAAGPVASVPISFPQAPSTGDTLEAFQKFTPPQAPTITGPTVPSLPLQTAPPREPPAPSVQSPFECDLAVLVSGLQEGASLTVKHGLDELSGYPFVGSPVWANLVKPARGADQMSARQRSNTCGGASGFSPAVGVNPAPKLPTPVIVGPICPNAPILRVRNLRPGAEVSVWAKRTSAASGSGVQVGLARAWAPDCDFPLPPAWANHPQLASQPGTLSIEVAQSNCGKGSDTASHPVEPLPGSVGQPGMDKPVECARLISAKSLTPGAVVVVRSDQADSPQLSGPVSVTASNMSIWVYRPLRKGEHVQLKQSGCNVAGDSPSTEVAPFAGVPAPVIVGPVRIPHGGATLRNLVTGARVHVWVSGLLTTSFDAIAPEMFVTLSGLTREAPVVARQAMCTKISAESNREVAKLGEMKPSHSPSPITRGKAASITVTAKDRDNGQPVNGSVKIGGSVVGATGTAFGFTFPNGPAPASSVEAANYVSAPISWNLVDPPPQPQAKLHLSIANQATSLFTITAVAWSVERQELNGTFTLIASPSGQSVVVQPPTNGQYHVYAAVSVDDLVNGGNILAEFRGNATVHGLHTLLVVWANVDLSENFRLFAEPQVIWAGGTAYTVYNPVVAL
jgi:hypothetical protein